MSETYHFSVPASARGVVPVLRLGRPVEKRHEVLLFSVDQNPNAFAEDSSFAWSDSFRSFFRYVPETAVPGIVRLRRFSLASPISSLSIRVANRRNESTPAVSDITLESSFGELRATFLPEENRA